MAVDIPDFTEAPDVWNACIFGGLRLPGLAMIDGLEPTQEWDYKKQKGGDGTTDTFQGYTPAHFAIVLQLPEAEDRQDWRTIVPVIMPKPGHERPDAIPISHPTLATYGITKCIIIGPGETFDTKRGMAIGKIRCRHWFQQPKKSVVVTATGIGTFANAFKSGRLGGIGGLVSGASSALGRVIPGVGKP